MQEINDYTPICVGCLNGERQLKPISADQDRYVMLLSFIGTSTLPAAATFCWECRALLRRTFGFLERVRLSHIALSQYYNQERTALIDGNQSLPHRQPQTPLELLKLQCYSTLELTHVMTLNVTNEADTELRPEQEPDYIDVKIKSECDDPFDVVADASSPGDCQYDPMDDEPLANRRDAASGEGLKKKRDCGTKTNKAKCKQKKPQPSPWYTHYKVVTVSEEQLKLWRAEDAASARYQRPPYKCATCLLAFNFSDQLQRHRADKHDQALGEWECDVCATRFARAADAAAHRRLHLARYECLHCEHVTRDKRDVERHYTAAHGEAQHPCAQCDAVFKTSSQLRYHRDDKHGSRWKCKHCDKTFRLRNNMYSHMLIHKKLPEAPCPVCGKVTRNKYSLKLHLKTHEAAARSWYCRPCDAHFRLESGYKSHLSTSMKHLTPDKLRFGCEECGRRFVTEKRRRRHHNSVHLKKSEFECDRCSKTYSTKLALRNHIAQKHDENYSGPPRDKICDICGKGFAVSGVLKSHMRTHTGERPYQCELCPSTFSHHAALYTHNRLIHLKIKRKKSSKKKPPETFQGKPEDPFY